MSNSTTTPAIDTVPELTSVGRLSAQLQRDPRQIAHAARSAGVSVTLRLNGVDHYDHEGIEKIAEHLRQATHAGGGDEPAAKTAPFGPVAGIYPVSD